MFITLVPFVETLCAHAQQGHDQWFYPLDFNFTKSWLDIFNVALATGSGLAYQKTTQKYDIFHKWSGLHKMKTVV